MKAARPVTIRLSDDGGTWFVAYADRKPRGKRLAAQFSAKYSKRAKVEAWVRDQADLTLVVDAPSD